MFELEALTQQSHLSQLAQVQVSQPQEAGMLTVECLMLVQLTKESSVVSEKVSGLFRNLGELEMGHLRGGQR